MLELTREGQSLTILPDSGGALRQWQVRGHDILHAVSLSGQQASQQGTGGLAVGAYPILPYIGPIAEGRFAFGGEEHHIAMEQNGADAKASLWTVAHKTDTHAILTLDHQPMGEDGQVKGDWPYKYRAALSYELRADGLYISIVLENRDRVDQPIGFGLSTCLNASMAARVRFEAETVWTLDAAGMPVASTACAEDWSHKQGNPVAGHAQVGCFADFGGTFRLDPGEGAPRVTVEADGIFSHITMEPHLEHGFIVFKPTTSLADGVNRMEQVGHGVQVVAPGQSLGGMIRLHVDAPRRPAEG